MEKHHRTQLSLALEELADTGIAEIKYRELYRTFDAERLTKGVWRQLLEQFSEIVDEGEKELAKKVRVVFPHQKDGIFLLYSGSHEPVKTLSAMTK